MLCLAGCLGSRGVVKRVSHWAGFESPSSQIGKSLDPTAVFMVVRLSPPRLTASSSAARRQGPVSILAPQCLEARQAHAGLIGKPPREYVAATSASPASILARPVRVGCSELLGSHRRGARFLKLRCKRAIGSRPVLAIERNRESIGSECFLKTAVPGANELVNPVHIKNLVAATFSQDQLLVNIEF